MQREPIYEFVKGEGWVLRTSREEREISFSDFASYKYDHWVCKFCLENPGKHRGQRCQGTDTIGIFYEP